MPALATSPIHPAPDLDVRSRDGLIRALDLVDREGWDGPTGGAVLRYAMRAVVVPAVRRLGVTGTAAESVEATGWAAAWEALRAPSLREVESPWGIVASAVRKAVFGEHLAERYGTGVRDAWQIRRFRVRDAADVAPRRGEWHTVADASALSRPVSLSALKDVGWEPRAAGIVDAEPCPRVEILTELLVRHGWSEPTARAAIRHVADFARPNPQGRPRTQGWREMSDELGLPQWQTRRLTVLLLGAGDWAGLVERLEVGGRAALEDPMIAAAVRATRHEGMRSPARTAHEMAMRQPTAAALAS